MKVAIITLNENSMTSGIVNNVIESSGDSAFGITLPLNEMTWACDNFDVAIGDEWNDGVFTRNGEPLTPIPTVDEQMAELQAQLDALLLGGESV